MSMTTLYFDDLNDDDRWVQPQDLSTTATFDDNDVRHRTYDTRS